MIFNFRIVSDEVDNFKREIQIDATATFLDLKKAICTCVGYDATQMSSFFLCDRNWEKEKEITFGTSKELQDGVFISQEVVPVRGVTSWDEVQYEELPEAVRSKYAAPKE